MVPGPDCVLFPDDSADVSQRLMGAFIRMKRLHWQRHVSDGIRPHEFGLMHTIRRLACQNPAGPRVSDLSESLQVTPPTITQQVSELERRGLVERRRDGGDRRSVRVALSGEGEALLARNRADLLSLFSRITEQLGPQKSETLASLLSEAAEYMEKESV